MQQVREDIATLKVMMQSLASNYEEGKQRRIRIDEKIEQRFDSIEKYISSIDDVQRRVEKKMVRYEGMFGGALWIIGVMGAAVTVAWGAIKELIMRNI